METFSEIKHFLDNHDDLEGVLTVDMSPFNSQASKPKYEIADEYVQTLGFTGIGNTWEKLDKSQTIELLTGMLHKSLAYRAEMLSLEMADLVASKFVSLFDQVDATYFCNGFIEDDSFGCNPISQSTMEMAIVAFDQEWIGIVCVEDED